MQLIKKRKDSNENIGDLLDIMLKGRDPKTGVGLSFENIRFQMVTFLIAGHEVSGSEQREDTKSVVLIPRPRLECFLSSSTTYSEILELPLP